MCEISYSKPPCCKSIELSQNQKLFEIIRCLICLVWFSFLCFDSYVCPIITMLTRFMTVYLCYYKGIREYHTVVTLV